MKIARWGGSETISTGTRGHFSTSEFNNTDGKIYVRQDTGDLPRPTTRDLISVNGAERERAYY